MHPSTSIAFTGTAKTPPTLVRQRCAVCKAATESAPKPAQINRRSILRLFATTCGALLTHSHALADVRVEDFSVGEGPEVEAGSVVTVRWVLRRSNGYFIDGNYGFDRFEDFTFTAGTQDTITGFDMGCRGLRAKGRRRFTISPDVGYAATGAKPGTPGPLPIEGAKRRAIRAHSNEPLIFEVYAVKVRPAPNTGKRTW